MLGRRFSTGNFNSYKLYGVTRSRALYGYLDECIMQLISQECGGDWHLTLGWAKTEKKEFLTEFASPGFHIKALYHLIGS